MKSIDYLKAAGIAMALLAVNVLIAVLVVTFYAMVINPGHPHEYYEAAALRIAPWCSHLAGTALFLFAGYFLTKRRPDRHPWWYAAAIWISYVIIDAASVGFTGVANVEFAVSMLIKLGALMVGAYFARRTRIASAARSNADA